MDLQYCIPTYRRHREILQAVSSVAVSNKKHHKSSCFISENGKNPAELTIRRLQDLARLYPIDVVYESVRADISPCHNWLNSLLMSSGPIVKLLFSDDQVIASPSDDSFEALNADPECFCVVSPVIIDFREGKRLSYEVQPSTCRILSSEYTRLIIERPDLVALSPSAYYFRREDILPSLAYCLTLSALRDCQKNGAGIDSLAMLTLMARGKGYVLYDSLGLTQFGAGNDSFTMLDIHSRCGVVPKNRHTAHAYFRRIGMTAHFASYSQFRKNNYG